MASPKGGLREITLLGKWRGSDANSSQSMIIEWNTNDISRRFRSTQRLKHLQRQTRGRVIPGHDKETFLALQAEKQVFT